MKPVLSLNGLKNNITKLGERVTNLLVFKKQADKSLEFNNRLWVCCTYSEALELAKEFVEIRE
jgi:hypothetical protein